MGLSRWEIFCILELLFESILLIIWILQWSWSLTCLQDNHMIWIPHHRTSRVWTFFMSHLQGMEVDVKVPQTMRCVLCLPTSSTLIVSKRQSSISLQPITRSRKGILNYNLAYGSTFRMKHVMNDHVANMERYKEVVATTNAPKKPKKPKYKHRKRNKEFWRILFFILHKKYTAFFVVKNPWLRYIMLRHNPKDHGMFCVANLAKMCNNLGDFRSLDDAYQCDTFCLVVNFIDSNRKP